MNTPQLQAVLLETTLMMEKLSASKGQEYAGSEDRLANFKRLGAQLGLPPEAILWVYLTKHLDSLSTYIRDLTKGTTREYSEPITGRVHDAILYLNLLKGLIIERDDLWGDLMWVNPGAVPVDTSIEQVQKDIREWADKVFPNRTADEILRKLIMEEVPEFLNGGANDPYEYADLVILILDVASVKGIDVARAVRKKMEVNRMRTWARKPNGLMQHADPEELCKHGEFPGCSLCKAEDDAHDRAMGGGLHD